MRTVLPPMPRVPKHIGRGAFLDAPAYTLADAGKVLTVNPAGDGYVYAAMTAGVTDHGALTGLADDHHTQYHNDARGDLRYQPLDADLTAIAALTTTAFGRARLTDVDAAALRSAAALGTIATEAETNYLLASGARAGAVAGAQAFTNGIAGKLLVTSSVANFENLLQLHNTAADWYQVVGNGNQFAAGYLVLAQGTPSASNWEAKFQGGGILAMKTAIASPSYNTAITGRGDVQIIKWTNTGGNFNGRLDVGQDFASGTSGVDLVIGPSAGVLNVRNNGGTSFLYVNSANGRVGIGNNTSPNNALDVIGTVQADGLRLDVTPTAETPTPTHTAVINFNGTNYKVLCLAA